MSHIIAAAATEHSLRPDDMMSRSRGQILAHARFEAWVVARAGFGYSLSQIARPWGYDHTSILHGLRVMVERRNDPSTLHRLVRITRRAKTLADMDARKNARAMREMARRLRGMAG